MDGDITADVNDVDGDGQIESADGDYVRLYIGMRRGGKSYYALDVTDRSNPKLLWSITKDSNSSNVLSELGESWSKMTKATIEIGTDVKDVLIFGGGYDNDQDDYAGHTPDSEGRAIFMVDAADGSVLWSAGTNAFGAPSFTETFADMQYSIPSEIRVLDINGDGFADQLYVGDMGGQLWRFDIYNGASVSALIEGGVIADFGDTDSDSSNNGTNSRRFYYAPSASLVRLDGDLKLVLTIGSGWRAHPLDDIVEDKFYMLRNQPLRNTQGATYSAITEADLYDATDNLIQDGSNTTSELTALAGEDGWFIKLEGQGEKVLAESTIINFQVLFTTYSPDVSTATGCQASVGTGRFYVVDLLTGTATLDFDGSSGGGDAGVDADVDGVYENLSKADRAVILANTGIPPEPMPYIPANDAEPIVFIGPEDYEVPFGDRLKRTYWRELLSGP